MVKVKICGITNLEDALACANAGTDALGFVFYKQSSRYIAPEKARAIIKQLPANIIKIGVFVNSREKTVKRIAKTCGLDILQFHGDESPEFCRRFKSYKVIKAFKVAGHIPEEKIMKYRIFAYLFDTHSNSQAGGTGRAFDWRLLGHLGHIKQPIFLSGGLSEKNIRAAIETTRPQWVDISSHLELRPGKKDHKKVEAFIKAAKGLA